MWECGPDVLDDVFPRRGPGGEDHGEGGVQNEFSFHDAGGDGEVGGDRGAVYLRHGGVGVRECGQRDPGAVHGMVECEADVVEAEHVVWARGEVAVVVGAFALPCDFGCVGWTARGGPGVKDVAPCTVPVAGECALYDRFNGFALGEAGFGAVDVFGQAVGSKGVVDVSTA